VPLVIPILIFLHFFVFELRAGIGQMGCQMDRQDMMQPIGRPHNNSRLMASVIFDVLAIQPWSNERMLSTVSLNVTF